MENREIGRTSIDVTAGIEPGKIQTETLAESSALGGVTNEERYQLIAEAAYFRAERRNFAPGGELDDWLNAETEIETRLKNQLR